MAFHTPDPKLRELELRNARLRAQVFAQLFGGLWRRLKRLVGRGRHQGVVEEGADAPTDCKPGDKARRG
ncbi:MAG: hypothetical protein JJU06_03685 [Ectothiorhodospiraceae bacterium]|nr:hypothetical protein [Ectothiorhodospiraceae bacterium]MCH8506907.1 hypothetical protein [Ectothiorhodospiraceae bacterium]